VLERVLVDQRVGFARAPDDEIATAEDDRLLDQVELWQGLGQAAKAATLRRISPGDPRVTSVDVARAAGVSQSTVSLVLSGKSAGRISRKTEEAVRRAAEELSYRPNIAARALRTGAARSVGLVVPDVTHPFFGLTMRGAQEAAWSAGYAVALVDVPLDRPLEAPLEALRAGPADGFIYFSVEPPERRPGGERIVVIEAEPEGVPWVSLDTAAGTDAALAHLIELGHRRIAQLGSRVQYPTFQIRMARWRAALESVGVEPVESLWAGAAFDFDDAAAAATRLLDVPDPPTAVVCDDDILAGGVYLAARDRGLRIPEDVSVVGFDDLPFARVLAPGLTTVRADARRLGAVAFEALLSVMAGEQVEGQTLPVELVVRDSTAPPRT
jgi:DNA-binding LacI/PurR family transcriptional regulator